MAIDSTTLTDTIDQVTRTIVHDMAAGRIPRTVRTFAALHDHVDANAYVAPLLDEGYDLDDLNRVADAVDARLRALPPMPTPYDAEIEDVGFYTHTDFMDRVRERLYERRTGYLQAVKDVAEVLRAAHAALLLQPVTHEIDTPYGLTVHARTFTPDQAHQRRDAKRAIRELLAGIDAAPADEQAQ